MSNQTAAVGVTISYKDADGSSKKFTESVNASYADGAIVEAGIDVPDATVSGTEYELTFGAIAAATALALVNDTGQDLELRINGAPGSVSGALVSGTKTMALASVTGEHLSVELVTSGGTPGILSVRRSGGNVIAESWLAGTGIQASDTSTVKVWQGGAPNIVRIPTGGMLLLAGSALPSANKLTSFTVVTTGTQDGAGKISYKIFGDPV